MDLYFETLEWFDISANIRINIINSKEISISDLNTTNSLEELKLLQEVLKEYISKKEKQNGN